MGTQEHTPWLLSKTSFIKGQQCIKSLYLHRYKRELKADPSELQSHIFKKGKSFEAQVRKALFPKGMDISQQLGTQIALYEVRTQELMSQNERCTLFEAGIISNQVLVLVDVLQKNQDGTISIFEIKNSTHLKSIAIWDASLQYYVCRAVFGDRLNGFNIVLKGKNNTPKVFEISNQLEKRQSQIQANLERFKEVLKEEQEPQMAMGKHCRIPFPCEYRNYCAGG